MTSLASLIIGLTVFIGTFVSGVFGMVGGQLILAVALIYMPVSAGMTLFSALMFTSGAWRGFLWRKHVHWPITLHYLIGSVIAYIIMLFVSFYPSKPVVYLGLGLTPLIADLLPKRLTPSIERKGMPFISGLIVMTLQISFSAGGNVLDAFFQKSTLNRHVTVATKAIMQLFAQAGRFFYFGLAALQADEQIPWSLLGIYILITFAGGSAAAGVLNRMSDANFRKGTRFLIWALSLIYVLRGLWLLLTDSTT
jgi:uncharacterized membrane protein YfcA